MTIFSITVNHVFYIHRDRADVAFVFFPCPLLIVNLGKPGFLVVVVVVVVVVFLAVKRMCLHRLR